MTPTQLRSYAAVVRLGSVRAAAAEIGVSEAAVSGNVGALRKELDDRLFRPSREGLVFTPGGLRLASRAVEMLGLQEQTRREVDAAHRGRRMLRIAATSLFAEYAAPGLIELFSARAEDLEVELLVQPSVGFRELLASHGADVAIGPKASELPAGIVGAEFLRYEVIAVLPQNFAGDPSICDWCLGPSAIEPSGVSRFILQRANVDEDRQRIYSSHAAALEAARREGAVALVPSFAVTSELESGSLRQLDGANAQATGTWTALSLPADRVSPVARELVRFVQTPRAIQAMLTGSGSNITRFKPRVHITLWS